MNRYGRQAEAHWAKWRPTELSTIANPQEFFSTLGLQVEARVEELALMLAGDDPAGEGYLAKVGRLRMAKFNAQEAAMRELMLPPAEPGHPQYDPEEDQGSGMFPAQPPWLPVVMTADHPNYHDMDDDPGLRILHNGPTSTGQTSSAPRP